MIFFGITASAKDVEKLHLRLITMDQVLCHLVT